jgi:hypothetical protein
MENPYWKTEGTSHYVDLQSIRLDCFDLLNIFEANKALHESFELLRAEARVEENRELSIEDAVLLDLHLEFSHKRISQLLLNIASRVRTYDDIMAETGEKYKAHASNNNGEDYIGAYSGNDKFGLRDACNKIIHALDVRPLYDHVDPVAWPSLVGAAAGKATPAQSDAAQEETLWYLTGEVELKGKLGGKSWDATLYCQNFIEIILDRINFGYPES